MFHSWLFLWSLLPWQCIESEYNYEKGFLTLRLHEQLARSHDTLEHILENVLFGLFFVNFEFLTKNDTMDYAQLSQHIKIPDISITLILVTMRNALI